MTIIPQTAHLFHSWFFTYNLEYSVFRYLWFIFFLYNSRPHQTPIQEKWKNNITFYALLFRITNFKLNHSKRFQDLLSQFCREPNFSFNVFHRKRNLHIMHRLSCAITFLLAWDSCHVHIFSFLKNLLLYHFIYRLAGEFLRYFLSIQKFMTFVPCVYNWHDPLLYIPQATSRNWYGRLPDTSVSGKLAAGQAKYSW